MCKILESFDFTAQWITMEGASEVPNCALQFYRAFEVLSEIPRPTVLRITAESYYVLFLNGIEVGHGPVRGSHTIDYFDTYDITKLLRIGENHLGVLVQSMNDGGNFNSFSAGCTLLAEAPGVVKSDAAWHVRPLPGWRNTTRPFNFQTGYRIEFDFREDDGDGWLMGADVESWANAVSFVSERLARKRLLPRGIPALREMAVVPQLLKSSLVKVELSDDQENVSKRLNSEEWLEAMPARVAGNAEDGWEVELPGDPTLGVAVVFDYGKPRTGYFEWTVEGEALAGVRVEVTYGEELWHGRVRAEHPQESYFFTDTYFLRNGRNHLCNPFSQHGGNLVQLVFRRTAGAASETPIRFRIHSAVCHDERYPYAPETRFRCSDPLLERIWEMCRQTISACTTDVFVDCPWREHAFWVNDLIIENLSSLVLFGPSEVHRRAFELAFSQQTSDGWVSAVVPDTLGENGRPVNVLPATNLFLFTMLEQYLMESGDADTVWRYLPNLWKILSAFEATRTEGDALVRPFEGTWNFYDWGLQMHRLIFDGCRESMLNSLYIIALKTWMRLCKRLDHPAEAEWCETRIAEITETLRREFYRPADGVLEDPAKTFAPGEEELRPTTARTELAQALALSSGVWGEEERHGFLKALKSHALLECDLYLSGLVWRALWENGEAAEVLERVRRHYGKIVRAGYDTIVEATVHLFGREAFDEAGSLCHGFATSAAIFFREAVLGLRPLEPGFRRFIFRPATLDLQYASGRVYTPTGSIEAKWEKSGDGLRLTLALPTDTTAILPDGTEVSGPSASEFQF